MVGVFEHPLARYLGALGTPAGRGALAVPGMTPAQNLAADIYQRRAADPLTEEYYATRIAASPDPEGAKRRHAMTLLGGQTPEEALAEAEETARVGLDLPLGFGASSAALGALGAFGPPGAVSSGQLGAQYTTKARAARRGHGKTLAATTEETLQTVRRTREVGSELAGWKRLAKASSKGKVGQYVGAPPGVTAPRHVNKLVDDYVARVEAAVDAGLQPGYFYARGNRELAAAITDPQRQRDFLYASGITSAETGVMINTNEAIRALAQQYMGAPIRAGVKHGAMSKALREYFSGARLDFGPKVRLYTEALLNPSGRDATGAWTRAPNDRWEIKGVWGDRDVLSSEPQHNFMHAMRAEATRRYNAKHGTDLTPVQVQELHWGAMKMRDQGKTVEQLMTEDTVQGLLPRRAFTATAETRPGEAAGMITGVTPGQASQAWHEAVAPTLVDPQGVDRLYGALGAPGQLPIEQGLGMYEGVVSPNQLARPLVALDMPSGMNWGTMAPESAALVDAAEKARGLLLAQDAMAGNMLIPPASTVRRGDIDALGVEWKGGATPERLAELERILGEIYPEAPPFVAPAPGGRTAVLAQPETPDFRKRWLAASKKGALAEDTPLGGAMADAAFAKQGALNPGPYRGYYAELPWGEAGDSPVTRMVIEAFDNPAAPQLAARADSKEMRGVVGDLLGKYEELEAAGKATVDPQFKRALRTWAQKGLPGLRDLAAKGLAPAFVMGLLGAREDEGA